MPVQNAGRRQLNATPTTTGGERVQRTDYDLLSIDEVARTLGQSVRNVRRMIRCGEFPEGFPAPKQVRWRWSVVRDWVLMHELAKKLRQKTDIPGQSGTSAHGVQNPPSEPKKRG